MKQNRILECVARAQLDGRPVVEFIDDDDSRKSENF